MNLRKKRLWMIHTDDLHCPNSAVSGLTAAGTTSSKLWIKWGPIPCNARQMSDLECVVNRDDPAGRIFLNPSLSEIVSGDGMIFCRGCITCFCISWSICAVWKPSHKKEVGQWHRTFHNKPHCHSRHNHHVLSLNSDRGHTPASVHHDRISHRILC